MVIFILTLDDFNFYRTKKSLKICVKDDVNWYLEKFGQTTNLYKGLLIKLDPQMYFATMIVS